MRNSRRDCLWLPHVRTGAMQPSTMTKRACFTHCHHSHPQLQALHLTRWRGPAPAMLLLQTAAASRLQEMHVPAAAASCLLCKPSPQRCWQSPAAAEPPCSVDSMHTMVHKGSDSGRCLLRCGGTVGEQAITLVPHSSVLLREPAFRVAVNGLPTPRAAGDCP
jgi:hypothetical protein